MNAPIWISWCLWFFFFNDTATTEIYTLSLHDALPIYPLSTTSPSGRTLRILPQMMRRLDRKSTRLNSSHLVISYAVFCLKKNTHFLSRWQLLQRFELQLLFHRFQSYILE